MVFTVLLYWIFFSLMTLVSAPQWLSDYSRKSIERAQLSILTTFRTFGMLHPPKRHVVLKFLMKNKDLFLKTCTACGLHTISGWNKPWRYSCICRFDQETCIQKSDSGTDINFCFKDYRMLPESTIKSIIFKEKNTYMSQKMCLIPLKNFWFSGETRSEEKASCCWGGSLGRLIGRVLYTEYFQLKNMQKESTEN